MTFTLFSGQARQIYTVAALLACGQAQATTLLHSSYDVARELFVALNPGFIAQWQQEHPGNKLTLRQSYAGSSQQALAYNQVSDVQILHDRGQLIAVDWRDRLPNQSAPYYSTMAFLVCKGNPKGIHDWRELARDGVQLVFPNPRPQETVAIPI